MNWYGRTKLLGEQLIEGLADGEFPDQLYRKSNLYDEHEIEGAPISKGTVINFFINRVFSGQPLMVYEPGTQFQDVAHAYVHECR